MSNSETEENPRTVASMPGMPTMRERWEEQRDFVIAIAARFDAQLAQKKGGFADELGALAGRGAGDEDKRAGLAERNVDGFGGADGGLAPLARAVEDDAIGVAVEDLGLEFVGDEAEDIPGKCLGTEAVCERRHVHCGYSFHPVSSLRARVAHSLRCLSVCGFVAA